MSSGLLMTTQDPIGNTDFVLTPAVGLELRLEGALRALLLAEAFRNFVPISPSPVTLHLPRGNGTLSTRPFAAYHKY